jgi:hypothetical protein
MILKIKKATQQMFKQVAQSAPAKKIKKFVLVGIDRYLILEQLSSYVHTRSYFSRLPNPFNLREKNFPVDPQQFEFY